MPSLMDLPREVLGLVVENLYRPPENPLGPPEYIWDELHQNDLAVVMRLHSTLHELAFPILYNNPFVQDIRSFFCGIKVWMDGPADLTALATDKRANKETMLLQTHRLVLLNPVDVDEGSNERPLSSIVELDTVLSSVEARTLKLLGNCTEISLSNLMGNMMHGLFAEYGGSATIRSLKGYNRHQVLLGAIGNQSSVKHWRRFGAGHIYGHDGSYRAPKGTIFTYDGSLIDHDNRECMPRGRQVDADRGYIFRFILRPPCVDEWVFFYDFEEEEALSKTDYNYGPYEVEVIKAYIDSVKTDNFGGSLFGDEYVTAVHRIFWGFNGNPLAIPTHPIGRNPIQPYVFIYLDPIDIFSPGSLTDEEKRVLIDEIKEEEDYPDHIEFRYIKDLPEEERDEREWHPANRVRWQPLS